VDLGQAVSLRRGQTSKYLHSLQGLLDEMLEISEDEDYILLADLMEYELLPMVREWQEILRNLASP
jgi:predicted house-cleaning noncanonical NTP pyrophosphatase (MazG superfamily)